MKTELIKIPYLYGAIGGYFLTSVFQIPPPSMYAWILIGFVSIVVTAWRYVKYKVDDDDYGDLDG